MRSTFFILIFGFILSNSNLFAQDTLPKFTVKNNKGKISVSWQNKYQKKIESITIQSSFDSLKKFSSLKVVSVPNDFVNGFFDIGVPYEKMFYRLFIVFDSGAYIFTPSKRPEVDPRFDLQKNMAKIREENKQATAAISAAKQAEKVQVVTPAKKEQIPAVKVIKTTKNESPVVTKTEEVKPESIPVTNTGEVKPEIPVKKEPVSTARSIYVSKDNNIVVSLPDYSSNKYVVRFFNDANERLFELNKVTESFLIIEKVNFLHAGWFFYEVYKNEKLVEKNKFYIPKD